MICLTGFARRSRFDAIGASMAPQPATAIPSKVVLRKAERLVRFEGKITLYFAWMPSVDILMPTFQSQIPFINLQDLQYAV